MLFSIIQREFWYECILNNVPIIINKTTVLIYNSAQNNLLILSLTFRISYRNTYIRFRINYINDILFIKQRF